MTGLTTNKPEPKVKYKLTPIFTAILDMDKKARAAEYKLVQAKTSKLSANQREFLTDLQTGEIQMPKQDKLGNWPRYAFGL